MKKITIYIDSKGRFSKTVKDWLIKNNLQFEEKNVDQQENLEEMFQISRQYAVPVVLIDDIVVLGFNEKRMHEVLSPN